MYDAEDREPVHAADELRTQLVRFVQSLLEPLDDQIDRRPVHLQVPHNQRFARLARSPCVQRSARIQCPTARIRRCMPTARQEPCVPEAFSTRRAERRSRSTGQHGRLVAAAKSAVFLRFRG